MQIGGLGRDKAQLFAKRTRLKVKSYRAIELYGDAVTQTDERKKAELLKLSLDEDPEFVYAARDLDALEQRMKGYSAAAAERQLEIDREVKAEAARREGSGQAVPVLSVGRLSSHVQVHQSAEDAQPRPVPQRQAPRDHDADRLMPGGEP